MQIAGYDISIDKIGRWPKWVQSTTVIGIFIVVVAAGSWVYIRGNLAEFQTLKLARDELKLQLSGKYKRLALLKQYEHDIKDIEQFLSSWTQATSEPDQIAEILEFVSAIGIENKLKFKLLKPFAETPQTHFSELPIEIVVEGRYPQFFQFLKKLAAEKYPLSIRNFTISGIQTEATSAPTTASTDKLNMAMTLIVYRPLPPKQETAPETNEPAKP